ncbi:Serine phosphatase RsbU, regulator of sigma subunit [Flexibacter flexilis DSM 6793]|uniref:Serine phosphatase RsbU, regulator of sigma subunit n=1 Tax=Flexibacter flexilis DSM 6793 TaxID=927664 RepID=A0A1I1F8H2_9BACT|nr:SpoIIE family protein phosphatase [Flexibacter flexilis]SFB95584.1 Serine phosphatase RsbU, regulator of sigma subunit [Flexibacter flexilis DSM 6793]
MPHNEEHPAQRLRIAYIIALSLVGIMTVCSQVIVRYMLKKDAADSRIINISGRQRMLSQKLTKTVLLLQQSENFKDYQQRHEELEQTLTLWRKSHLGLLHGDISLRIPAGHNSDTIRQMFAQIQPHFVAMSDAAQNILILADTPQIKQQTRIILAHESEFLQKMDTITFRYDQEAKERIHTLEILETELMLVTLIVLMLEAYFIFRPATNKIKEYFEQIKAKNIELVYTNSALIETQEELKTNIEELQAAEEEIRQQMEEISAINDTLSEQKSVVDQQKKLIDMRNQNIMDNIKAAKRVQDTFLLSKDVLAKEFADAFVINRPKEIVTGDFYWFHKQGDTKIMAVGNCTGNGMSGALLTMVGVSLFNEVINECTAYLPEDILQKVDAKLRQILNPNTQGVIAEGIKLSLLVIDGNCLHFAGAGSNLFWISDGILEEIKGSKYPLGEFSFYKEKEFESIKINYRKDDQFYMFTDGLVEQIGQIERRKLGSENLKRVIVTNAYSSMLQQFTAIQQELHLWKGAVAQTDDMMLIGLKM